jgi:hypothetical protein
MTWQRISGDPGTASAATFAAGGTIQAYLNATPADSTETLTGWGRFRLRHNAAEGDRNVRLIAAENNIALGAGRGACVVDDYATSRSRYRELACLVAPANGHQRTVLIAAAQAEAWTHEQAVLEFAVGHFIT